MPSSLLKPLAGLFLLCLTLAPLRLTAQEPPQLLIESIVVEGVSQAAGRRIVADETLLKLGKSYTENEVRQAVYRVRRLPFVVNAEYALRKGEHDGYALVIEVIEQTPVFLSAGTNGDRSQQFDFSAGRNRTTTTWQQFGSLGARTFLGSNGIGEASVQKQQHQDGEFIQGTYTQYDLLRAGTSLRGGISSAQGFKNYDQTFAFLDGVLPLTAAQSIDVSLSWGRTNQTFFGDSFKDVSRGAALAWTYDTMDDPLFPMSGSKGFASWSYNRDTNDEKVSFNGEQLSRRLVSDARTFTVGATHYFPVATHQSILLAANLYRANLASDTASNVPWQWTLAVGHAITLLGFDRTHRYGDLRFENYVATTYNYLEAASGFGSRSSRDASFVSSLGYRSRWGVLRATLTYSGLWRSR